MQNVIKNDKFTTIHHIDNGFVVSEIYFTDDGNMIIDYDVPYHKFNKKEGEA